MADLNTNNTENVSTGKPQFGGAIFIGQNGATLPTNANDDISMQFDNVGFISQDGVTNGFSLTPEVIKSFKGDTVDSVNTSHIETFQFTAIETRRASASIFFGNENIQLSGSNFNIESSALYDNNIRPLIIELVKDENTKERIVIPNSKLYNKGDVTYKDDELIAYDVTLIALPDDNSVKSYRYITNHSDSPDPQPVDREVLYETDFTEIDDNWFYLTQYLKDNNGAGHFTDNGFGADGQAFVDITRTDYINNVPYLSAEPTTDTLQAVGLGIEKPLYANKLHFEGGFEYREGEQQGGVYIDLIGRPNGLDGTGDPYLLFRFRAMDNHADEHYYNRSVVYRNSSDELVTLENGSTTDLYQGRLTGDLEFNASGDFEMSYTTSYNTSNSIFIPANDIGFTMNDVVAIHVFNLGIQYQGTSEPYTASPIPIHFTKFEYIYEQAKGYVPVESISVEQEYETGIGGSEIITVNVSPNDASNKYIDFDVDSEYFEYTQIANNAIEITPIKLGSSVITVTSNDNPELSVTTTVHVVDAVPVESITLTRSTGFIYDNASPLVCTYTATVLPENATLKDLEWTIEGQYAYLTGIIPVSDTQAEVTVITPSIAGNSYNVIPTVSSKYYPEITNNLGNLNIRNAVESIALSESSIQFDEVGQTISVRINKTKQRSFSANWNIILRKPDVVSAVVRTVSDSELYLDITSLAYGDVDVYVESSTKPSANATVHCAIGVEMTSVTRSQTQNILWINRTDESNTNSITASYLPENASPNDLELVQVSGGSYCSITQKSNTTWDIVYSNPTNTGNAVTLGFHARSKYFDAFVYWTNDFFSAPITMSVQTPDVTVGVGEIETVISNTTPPSATTGTHASATRGQLNIVSSNPAVATARQTVTNTQVNMPIEITGVSAGTCTITLSPIFGGTTVSSTINVTVVDEIPLQSIEIVGDDFLVQNVDPYKTATVTANLIPSNTTQKDITWFADSQDILNMTITDNGDGTCTVDNQAFTLVGGQDIARYIRCRSDFDETIRTQKPIRFRRAVTSANVDRPVLTVFKDEETIVNITRVLPRSSIVLGGTGIQSWTITSTDSTIATATQLDNTDVAEQRLQVNGIGVGQCDITLASSLNPSVTVPIVVNVKDPIFEDSLQTPLAGSTLENYGSNTIDYRGVLYMPANSEGEYKAPLRSSYTFTNTKTLEWGFEFITTSDSYNYFSIDMYSMDDSNANQIFNVRVRRVRETAKAETFVRFIPFGNSDFAEEIDIEDRLDIYNDMKFTLTYNSLMLRWELKAYHKSTLILSQNIGATSGIINPNIANTQAGLYMFNEPWSGGNGVSIQNLYINQYDTE